MELVLVRHAIAEDRVEWAGTGRPDRERPLTEKGRRRMEQGALGLKRLVPEIDSILSSDLVRAKETAEILLGQFPTAELVVSKALGEEYSPQELLTELLELDPESSVALVGHEPDFSELVSLLLTAQTETFVEVKKGSAILVSFEGQPGWDRGMLRWALPPVVLRALGTPVTGS